MFLSQRTKRGVTQDKRLISIFSLDLQLFSDLLRGISQSLGVIFPIGGQEYAISGLLSVDGFQANKMRDILSSRSEKIGEKECGKQTFQALTYLLEAANCLGSFCSSCFSLLSIQSSDHFSGSGIILSSVEILRPHKK